MVDDELVDSGRGLVVEALGALCELSSNDLGGSPAVDVGEYADLSDGRRVFWKEDRGWAGSSKFSLWPVYSGRDLAYETMMVTDTDEHRLDSYVELALDCLRNMGLSVDPASVYCAPFRVEHGPRLEEEMRRAAQLFNPSPRSQDSVLQSDVTAYRGEDRAALYRGGDRVASERIDDGQSGPSEWRASTHASSCSDSADSEEDPVRLQLEMPRALLERFVSLCHDQQVTMSEVMRSLVEEYLDSLACE